MGNLPKKVRRQKLLVNPRLQFALIAYSVCFGVICMVSVHLSYMSTQLNQLNVPLIGAVPTSIIAALPFLALFFAFLGGLHLSNKVAGPIFAIERQLQEIQRNGGQGLVHSRKGDYFQDLVEGINAVLKQRGKAD